jgi:hypothetical protein
MSPPIYIVAPFDRLDSDEAQLSKLQQLGMTLDEEGKLLAMKDIIRKLANNLARFESLSSLS